MKLGNCAVFIGSVLAAIGAMGCGNKQPLPVNSVREIMSPAGPGSGQGNLATGPNSDTYLSWMETEGDSPVLKFAAMKDGKWSDTQTIVKGKDLMVNYADFPSLLPLGNGVIAAHWATLIPKAEEGYNVDISLTHDNGKTWSAPIVPHHDGTPTEHGFVSMTSAPGGGMGVIWLDSRKLNEPGGSDDVALMYTSIDPTGKVGTETNVDPRVCECCQPSSVRTSNGVLAVYRDRSPDEIRDIAIIRFDGSKWSAPKIVSADGWKISACPINGPAIAEHDNRVAVAWFTAPNDKPKAELAFSTDGGNSFGAPIQVDDGKPLGHVDVVALNSGSAVVTWLEGSEKGGQLRARQVDPDGTRHPSLVVGATSSGTFPRAQRVGDNVLLVWTDTTDNRVRLATLEAKK